MLPAADPAIRQSQKLRLLHNDLCSLSPFCFSRPTRGCAGGTCYESNTATVPLAGEWVRAPIPHWRLASQPYHALAGEPRLHSTLCRRDPAARLGDAPAGQELLEEVQPRAGLHAGLLDPPPPCHACF